MHTSVSMPRSAGFMRKFQFTFNKAYLCFALLLPLLSSYNNTVYCNDISLEQFQIEGLEPLVVGKNGSKKNDSDNSRDTGNGNSAPNTADSFNAPIDSSDRGSGGDINISSRSDGIGKKINKKSENDLGANDLSLLIKENSKKRTVDKKKFRNSTQKQGGIESGPGGDIVLESKIERSDIRNISEKDREINNGKDFKRNLKESNISKNNIGRNIAKKAEIASDDSQVNFRISSDDIPQLRDVVERSKKRVNGKEENVAITPLNLADLDLKNLDSKDSGDANSGGANNGAMNSKISDKKDKRSMAKGDSAPHIELSFNDISISEPAKANKNKAMDIELNDAARANGDIDIEGEKENPIIDRRKDDIMVLDRGSPDSDRKKYTDRKKSKAINTHIKAKNKKEEQRNNIENRVGAGIDLDLADLQWENTRRIERKNSENRVGLRGDENNIANNIANNVVNKNGANRTINNDLMNAKNDITIYSSNGRADKASGGSKSQISIRRATADEANMTKAKEKRAKKEDINSVTFNKSRKKDHLSNAEFNMMLDSKEKIVNDKINDFDNTKSGDSRRVKSSKAFNESKFIAPDTDEVEKVLSLSSRVGANPEYNNYRVSLPQSVYKDKYSQSNRHLPKALYSDQYTTSLFDAIRENNIPAIKALVKKGANINFVEKKSGYTPLMYAATNVRYLASIRYLLMIGADPNKAGKNGITPMHIAAKNNIFIAMRLLLISGADIEISDSYGLRPTRYLDLSKIPANNIIELQSQYKNASYQLIDFAALNYYRGVENAIMKRADPNIIDSYSGKTALHFAVEYGNANIASILMLSNANPFISDRRGQNAIQLTKRNGDKKLTAIIQTVVAKNRLDVALRASS